MLVTNIKRMGRKERTREALLVAALELFAEQGYDATTTAAIARRAGVSEMTLFRHFATKDALLVDDPYDPLIGEAITARPAGERPLTAAVRGVRDAWGAIPEPATEEVRERLQVRSPGAAGRRRRRSPTPWYGGGRRRRRHGSSQPPSSPGSTPRCSTGHAAPSPTWAVP